MDDSLFYRLVRWTSIPLFRLYFPLRRAGLERVPAEGPLLVAANHASYLDPAALGSALPRPIHFLINARVWRAAPMSWFYRGMRAIPVDRDGRPTREAISTALRRLREGRVVGIFPDGGRVDELSVDRALGGVALLARHSGAAVLPVGIAGTAESMPRGAGLPEPLPLRVHFGETFRYEAPEDAGPRARRLADRRFTETLMGRIADLVEEAENLRVGPARARRSS